MNLDQALETFVAESRELLEQMEQGLLAIGARGADEDTLNAIFRAAHTIKGSAGLFGLDAVVAFTHVVESVLDKVRAGETTMDAELSAVFLKCRDHIAALVDASAAESGGTLAELAAAGDALRTSLGKYLGKPAMPAVAPAHRAAQARTTAAGPQIANDHWHISVRFGRDVLRHGMDPLAFIRYLGTVGDIIAIETLADAMPPADEMDPESCYLGFAIVFRTSADKGAIESIFEFVRDDCQLRILPPGSKASEYIALIKALPEEETRVGEMLVKSGALTAAELAEALAEQREHVAASEGAHALAPIGQILVDHGVVRQPVVQAALDKQKHIKEMKARESGSLRVDADKLDRLINLVGELVIAGAGVNLAAQRAGLADLKETTATLQHLVEEVRDASLQLRMVQIGATFNRFQRVVHDVAKELGKAIALVITGADTELDKMVVEKIGDPLTHLVRNAMDHGIEPADVRAQRGKPAHGTVTLNAYHDAGSIVIEVGDDGGGLNRDKIFAKAIERGLVEPEQTLSDRDVYNLIFEPGLSTAESVTSLSGRGVGMDVVKRNITALRGTVDIDSREGAGTTVRIRLPLTLAIIDGFLVGIGESVLVVPLEMVEECIELPAAAQSDDEHPHYVNLRGQVLPFIELRERFEIAGEPPRRRSIVVVRDATQRAGLVVDRLLGEFQTVIKPLGKMFRTLRGISGSTILGNGRVALILDVPGLLATVEDRHAAPALSH